MDVLSGLCLLGLVVAIVSELGQTAEQRNCPGFPAVTVQNANIRRGRRIGTEKIVRSARSLLTFVKTALERAAWVYVTAWKPKLGKSHFSDYAQSQRSDLSRRTVTPVPTSSPNCFPSIMTCAGLRPHSRADAIYVG